MSIIFGQNNKWSQTDIHNIAEFLDQ